MREGLALHPFLRGTVLPHYIIISLGSDMVQVELIPLLSYSKQRHVIQAYQQNTSFHLAISLLMYGQILIRVNKNPLWACAEFTN